MKFTKTHGLSRTEIYARWRQMMGRCYDPVCVAYPKYGAVGISVCDEWHDLSNFVSWANSNGWAEGLSLDRKDATKDYSPDNCRWVTRREQAANRRPKRIQSNGFRGVEKQFKRFRAYLRIDGKKKHLGSFATAREAAIAHDEAAMELYGDVAQLNFPTVLR